MKFAVGDVVEVVKAQHPAKRAWLGRQLVVTGFITGRSDQQMELHTRVVTSPSPPAGTGVAWHPDALRKINPPDWEAPRVTDRELVE